MMYYLLFLAIAVPVFDTSNVEAPFDSLPRDCSEVVGNKSTVYRIKPPIAQKPFFVYCDLENQGGGWTVFQRRTDGLLDFSRDWKDYKNGFGNIERDFWLGLEKIYSLTNQKVNELYVEMEDFTPDKRYARYSTFAVGTETEGYPINILGKYEGTAGDSLEYHQGQKFTTFDLDNSKYGNCSSHHKGGWWFKSCSRSNLNGQYLKGEYSLDDHKWNGMYWCDFRDYNYSLKASKMMIRPVRDTFYLNYN